MNQEKPASVVGLSGEVPALAHLHTYRDDVVLEQAWNRLQTRRRRSVVSPVGRILAAAALLFCGVGLGVLLERSQKANLNQALVASETVQSLGATADPSLGPRAPARASDAVRKETEELRRRNLGLKNSARSRRGHISEATVSALQDLSPEASGLQDFTAAPRPDWLVLADRGEYTSAFQKLDESGGFDGILAHGSSEELMTVVDIARVVGRQGRAIQALRVVTEKYQTDPNAPLAAMILGNLLDRAGDQAGAAEAYALNRRLSPGGDFAEDALVREFDMAKADGDLARVEQLRTQYEAEFPEGRYLEAMRAEAARLAELERTADEIMGVAPAKPVVGSSATSGTAAPSTATSGTAASPPEGEEAPADSQPEKSETDGDKPEADGSRSDSTDKPN